MTRTFTKELGEGMLAVRRSMAREFLLTAIQALGQSDLTLLQLGTLLLLEDGEERTVGALSEQIGRSLSATSRLVEQLVKRELLRRQEDPNDRRARRVTLSPGGRKFLLTMMRRRAEAELKLVEALAPEDQRTVLRALELMAEAARSRKVDDV
jgi:DNA-binding MarR family transcriptional regulator